MTTDEGTHLAADTAGTAKKPKTNKPDHQGCHHGQYRRHGVSTAMPKAGQQKDGGGVVVLLTEDCDEKAVRALCHHLGRELGTIVMEWLKRPAAMRKTDRTD